MIIFRLINGEVVPATEGIYGRDSDEEVHEDIAYGSFGDPNRSKTFLLKLIQKGSKSYFKINFVHL